jgi:hypothetical protein
MFANSCGMFRTQSSGGAMKRVLLGFVLVLCGCVWTVAQAKQAEYNINVNVSASRSVKHTESAPRYQYLNVTIDGRNYELESVQAVRGLLMLGDYKAKLVTDEHGKGDYDFRQVYEFQFSDKRTRQFSVVGQLE